MFRMVRARAHAGTESLANIICTDSNPIPPKSCSVSLDNASQRMIVITDERQVACTIKGIICCARTHHWWRRFDEAARKVIITCIHYSVVAASACLHDRSLGRIRSARCRSLGSKCSRWRFNYKAAGKCIYHTECNNLYYKIYVYCKIICSPMFGPPLVGVPNIYIYQSQ